MVQTSRGRVRRCLTFQHPDRVPLAWYALPWAQLHYADHLKTLKERFLVDLGGPADVYCRWLRLRSDPHCGPRRG